MDLPISTVFGNIEVNIPTSTTQIATGIIIQSDGLSSIRNYPNWVKFSPIVTSTNLPYLSKFGYDIDLVHQKSNLYGESENQAVNYIARSLLFICQSKKPIDGPYGDIFLMDNAKKLTIDDYNKIMSILRIVPCMSWKPRDEIINGFDLAVNHQIWKNLLNTTDDEYYDVWMQQGLTLKPDNPTFDYSGEYWNLLDSLIKYFTDTSNLSFLEVIDRITDQRKLQESSESEIHSKQQVCESITPYESSNSQITQDMLDSSNSRTRDDSLKEKITKTLDKKKAIEPIKLKKPVQIAALSKRQKRAIGRLKSVA